MGNVTTMVNSSNCLVKVLTVSNFSVNNEWIMDPDCSFHMCPNIDWFQNFNNREIETVYMGNNHSCSVQGIGDISIKLHDNKIRNLTDVRCDCTLTLQLKDNKFRFFLFYFW